MVRPPVLVLTGFLGSGKTTVLAELLRRGTGGRVAVLVNEVASLPIDHHLLERVDEDVLALPSGCVCCALQDDLHEALRRVVSHAPDRVVLETTGLADPAPLLHGLATSPRVTGLVRPGGVVAVVDALRAEELHVAHPEFARQLELADRVVLTKGDLAPDRLPGVRALLAEAAPGCEVREARDGVVDPEWLLDGPALHGVAAAADVARWLHHGVDRGADRAADPGAGDAPRPRGDGGADGGSDPPRAGADGPAGARTHVVTHDAPVDVAALQLWLRLVTQLDGSRLLRVKAVATCAATGDVVVLQAAGRSVSPPRRLTRRPAGLVGVQAVVVERGLGAAGAARVLDALEEAVRGARREASG